MTPKTYSEEFKKAAVDRAANSGLSRNQIARDLGIKPDTLRGWIRHYTASVPPEPQDDKDAEIARLRKALGRAEMERDILKKAIGIFSEEQR
jgi:transposase